jgi:hypothetical protein
MRSRLASCLALGVCFLAAPAAAFAQGDQGAPAPTTSAPQPAPAPAPAPDEPAATPDPATDTAPVQLPQPKSPDTGDDSQPQLDPEGGVAPEEARFGAGLRIRRVSIPKALIEVFVEKAATGVSGTGFGVELYRRRGNFELQVGFEYEGLDGDPGIWVDKNKTLTSEGPDFVQFDDFGWFTIEVNFINHTPLSKYIALRYGGGAGLGILKGSVKRTDYVCTANDESTCSQDPAAVNVEEPYDFPPVFPVINAIIGMQFRPIENVVINVEGGLRTLLYFGLTAGYYF